MNSKLSWMNAAFVGGNFNFEYNEKPDKNGVTVQIDPEYFKFLKSEGIKWVGFQVELYLQNVRDDTVGTHFAPANNPGAGGCTMTDANLKYVLKEFQDHGFKTYLTSDFNELNSGKSPPRWLYGKTYGSDVAQYYDEKDWMWDPSHPNHEQFIANFWQSYTKEMVHYAKIAKNYGVDMLGLGTETDSLFHTHETEASQQSFGDYINKMINSIRSQYSGLLTYDQHSDAVLHNDYYQGRDLWTSTSLDVIGISAYFPLLTEVNGVSSVRLLEKAWRNIFENTLKPLQEENPDKSIVFTEFGYTDSIYSPVQYDAEQFQKHKFSDTNHNGLDDGQETQANIYKAFFNINHEYGDLVAGVFAWSAGGHVVSDEGYEYEKDMTGFPIRGKLAAKVLAHEYHLNSSARGDEFGAESGHHAGDSRSFEFKDFAAPHNFGSDLLF